MSRLTALVLVLVAAALAAGPAAAAPGRISVGVVDGAPRDDVGAAVAAATGGRVTVDMESLDAFVVSVPDVDAAVEAARSVGGVTYAEPATAERRLAWTPNDPLVPSQWYLGAIRAFDAWPTPPVLPPVLVAVVDSGIDGSHPEFAGRIAGARSFVGGQATVDTEGHGTIVAGEIAATLDNAQGIAGVGAPARLLVAKVVDDQGRISIVAEARAIRWAVDSGARVVNLSLGGPRDPTDPARDTYSALEQAAVDYATRRGVVVVAAAGNCSLASCPERYASYPAALPHVLGAAALAPDGSVPSFSNRDSTYVDLAAPGSEILSTFPLNLSTAGCNPAGFTPCAQDATLRSPRGTSFAAPLASAAAALLIAQQSATGGGGLHSSQITTILERAAVDTGARGRDRATGFGRLDVPRAMSALGHPLPARDQFETNDEAGSLAWALRGARRTIKATLDRFDDTRDVYRVRLSRGQSLFLRLAGPAGGQSNLYLWRPGTRRVGPGANLRNRVARSTRRGSTERIDFRATRAGAYYVEVRLLSGRSGAYRLGLAKR